MPSRCYGYRDEQGFQSTCLYEAPLEKNMKKMCAKGNIFIYLL